MTNDVKSHFRKAFIIPNISSYSFAQTPISLQRCLEGLFRKLVGA